MNDVRHEYYLDGSRIIKETWADQTLEFLYDENGSVYCIVYTGGDGAGRYYLIKNLQGDVTRILNNNLETVAQYVYDPWGKLVNILDADGEPNSGISIANINPIRYRGYYFDMETGFYYLNARYYDPALGRFINPDSQLNTSHGILGFNQFAYCLNNPINMTDFDGNKPGDLFDTMDEAARDFAEYINRTSIEDNREYASYIYTKTTWETKKVTYYNPSAFRKNIFAQFFNYIFGGKPTKSITIRVKVTKYTYVSPSRGTNKSSIIPINWFGLRNQVALLHTHAAYDSGYRNDIFSQKDKDLAARRNMPIYVATPMGTLRRYDPSNGTDIVIFEDIPFDPNHPGRK